MNAPHDNKPIEIVLADDHGVVISGLEEWLNRCKGIKVTGTVTDGKALLEMVDLKQPDIVLTDIRMPILDGFEAAKVIQEKYPAIGLIALTGDERPSMIGHLVMARFDGIVLKSADEEEIFEAIQHVYQSHSYYCRQTNRILNLLSDMGVFNFKNGTIKKLFSEQEEKIFKLMLENLSSFEIGEKLGINYRTVETYRQRMYLKTGTKGIISLVKWGLENGYC